MVQIIIDQDGFSIPRTFLISTLGKEKFRSLLKELTIIEKSFGPYSKYIPKVTREAYKITKKYDGDWIILPKIWGLKILQENILCKNQIEITDNTTPRATSARKIERSRCCPSSVLFKYQKVILEYLCRPNGGPLSRNNIRGGHGRAYLQMDVGLGKTRVGCALTAHLRWPSLVVVPTLAIAEQWIEEFSTYLPELNTTIYRNSDGDKVTAKTHDVVIVIINTFRNKMPAFIKGFGVLILDEAHEYHSEHNSKALWLAQTPAVLGLSATPYERPDGMDRYVSLHLGPAIWADSIPGFDVQELTFHGKVRAIYYDGHPDFCNTILTKRGVASSIQTIGTIIQDPHRLNLIIKEILRIYHLHLTESTTDLRTLGLFRDGSRKRHGIFVFAEHREFLLTLRLALLQHLEENEILMPEFSDNEGEDGAGGPNDAPRGGSGEAGLISVLRGGAPRGAVESARKMGAHIVLTTYGYSRRGISLPDMTALVLTTPRRNGMNQILGRILRRGSDQKILRLVIDIIDINSCFYHQFRDRAKVYMARRFPIEKNNVQWGDVPLLDPNNEKTLKGAYKYN